MLSERYRLKQAEIKTRGLLSFPSDSTEDLQAVAELSVMLKCLEGTREFTSPSCGLKIAVDRHFSPRMLYYFLIGDYEQGDLELIRKHVQTGDRALELGGGIGVTGSLLGQVTGQRVTVCEPNPTLEPLIRRTFSANGQQLRLIQAAAVKESEGDGRTTLNVAPGYWWSSLLSVHGATSLQVQSIRLSRLLELTEANVLLVDIEGYEQHLFEGCDLARVDTLIIEIHAPSLGAPNSSALLTELIRREFDLVDFAAQSFVFKRSQRKEQVR
ncbi:FkbM family methyltransferase [Pseudomonas chengduensis]|jgi:FkbM family methyltransferase|uniref:Methyltransferase, FkbM family n=1 Tax=Pseudomonas sihuiensis TaxID=1274359 RepID=A0A1H2LSP2_9PSED|nr:MULTISPECIES: FkbM family methyltransferase [Pseudomonas]MDH1684399.1 FkbM family methyltransferase [Pseudomonas chengduensis]SDU83765.1 methyltransferase, FkbM family [Pseudomonas sihuiensis]HCF1761186.1 FkbM family methyltransferase [Pseudomonas aeruginosa]